MQKLPRHALKIYAQPCVSAPRKKAHVAWEFRSRAWGGFGAGSHRVTELTLPYFIIPYSLRLPKPLIRFTQHSQCDTILPNATGLCSVISNCARRRHVLKPKSQLFSASGTTAVIGSYVLGLHLTLSDLAPNSLYAAEKFPDGEFTHS